MCDEDVIICFVMVAMNSFLCLNSALVPSTKYFGIFDDINNLKEFDWSAFVLQWLLDHIKTFNKCKMDIGQTLGGCIP
uniref:Aminotransferase-like plant mobile domain-containing protein n=1 Tax=Arundo donax TaxID=35708 RepID=A0A0A9EYD7_ARUDO